jgi:hypothetical protein
VGSTNCRRQRFCLIQIVFGTTPLLTSVEELTIRGEGQEVSIGERRASRPPDVSKGALEHRLLESSEPKFISIPDKGGLDLLDLCGDVKVL